MWDPVSFIRRFYELHRIRFTKFLIAGIGGFLVSELIIILGLWIFGIRMTIPVIVVAGILSITFGFAVNEKWSMADSPVVRTLFPTMVRLGKFQLVYLLGNIVSWATMLILLRFFSLSPAYGNIPGSVVAVPVNYLVSAKLVWKLKLT